MDNTNLLSSLTRCKQYEENREFRALVFVYQTSPESDRQTLEALIYCLVDRVTGLGPVGAFELLGKMGLRLAWSDGTVRQRLAEEVAQGAAQGATHER